jgi:hypothetical protein
VSNADEGEQSQKRDSETGRQDGGPGPGSIFGSAKDFPFKNMNGSRAMGGGGGGGLADRAKLLLSVRKPDPKTGTKPLGSDSNTGLAKVTGPGLAGAVAQAGN